MQKANRISYINTELLRKNVVRQFIGLNYYIEQILLLRSNLKAYLKIP